MWKCLTQGSASGSGGPEPDRAEPDFGLRVGLRDGFQKSRARAQPDVSPISEDWILVDKNRAGIGMGNTSPIGMEIGGLSPVGMDFRGPGRAARMPTPGLTVSGLELVPSRNITRYWLILPPVFSTFSWYDETDRIKLLQRLVHYLHKSFHWYYRQIGYQSWFFSSTVNTEKKMML